MKLRQYTDDQLIAYLLNEGTLESRSALERDLLAEPALAARLETLREITNQLRRLPLEAFYSTRRSYSAISLSLKAMLLAVIFFTGALAQVEFSIIGGHADVPKNSMSTLSGDFPISHRIFM